MKKSLAICLLLAICGCMTFSAQNTRKQQLIDQILSFQKCLEENTRPELHEETIKLSNGKIIRTKAQSDFARSQFTSIDAVLEDLMLWKDSPYLWEAKRQKTKKTLMDTQDLTDWEVNSLETISKEYFKEGNSAFHLAAHGLVDPDGAPANAIQMGGETLNAKETAELILKSMANVYHNLIEVKNEPFVIVLHCCNTANGDNNFAQQLSVEMSKYIKQVAVIGAPGVVYCEKTSDGKYTESVTPYVGSNQQQNWKVYKNGSEHMEGQTDYKSTIRSYVEDFQNSNPQKQ